METYQRKLEVCYYRSTLEELGSIMKIDKICKDIFNIATDIFEELGGGFNETVNQNALAMELRNSKVNYLKEVNIEIFYKGESIGTDRPDFVLLPSRKKGWSLNEPILLETKVTPAINNEHRQQLKSYFKSFPRNKNSTLHHIKKGILLKFLKSEDYIDPDKTKPSIELECWDYKKSSGNMKLVLSLPLSELKDT